jgi:hypothetical protein
MDIHIVDLDMIITILIILFLATTFDGGENGIRTHERIAPLHAFQACAFNRSATSPFIYQSTLL